MQMQKAVSLQNLPIKIPPEILDLIRQAREVSASVDGIEAVIEEKKAELDRAQEELAAAEAQQNTGHQDFDFTKADQVQAFIKATEIQTKVVQEKRLAVDVAARVHAAFAARGADAAADAAALAMSLDTELTAFRQQLRLQIGVELELLLQPAFQLLRFSWELQQVLRIANINDAIMNMVIPNPGNHLQPLAEAGYVVMDGKRCNLLQHAASEQTREMLKDLTWASRRLEELRCHGRG
jgi:hypothetical protein